MYDIQEILKEQIEERRETAKKVWKIYLDEMKRLIENPGARPDTSVLERFIANENGTFGQSLAKLFIDAIEFGYCHASTISELAVKEDKIPGVVRLADVPPMHPKADEFWQTYEGLLVKRDTERFDEHIDTDFHEYSTKYPDAADQLLKAYQYVMKKRVQWFS